MTPINPMKTTEQTAAHTPGPWALDVMPNTTYIGQPKANSSGLFSIVAQCDCGSEDGYVIAAHETKMANARLIAAAPDLLDIAQWVATELPAIIRQCCPSGVPMSVSGIHDQARAAIARATQP